MKVSLPIRIMRSLFPRTEKHRREFRILLAEIEASAEDLSRTAMNGRRNGTIDHLTNPKKK